MNWDTVTLGEICDLVNGKAYNAQDWATEGVPIIRIQNLNGVDKPFNYWSGPLDREVQVKDGDILLAWSGTPGTSFGAHTWRRGGGVLNQHIFRLDIDRKRLTGDWAVTCINHQLHRLIGQAHGGVGLQHVTKPMVQGLRIPLPPLPEQRRIAAILDKADAIRRKREEGVKLTEELLRSTFLEMFGDPAKQSLWEEKSLGEVVEIASGQVDPKEQPYASMQHVGGDNIESHTGEIRDAATAEELELISGKYEFTPQDVLYSKIRPALNKVACPNFHGICSADIYPIRPSTGKMGREYLASLLRSEDFLAYATKHSSRTNIPKINRPALLSYNVKLPHFGDQLRFEAVAKQIREMKCHRITACDLAETCFGSLVQRAFRGEL